MNLNTIEILGVNISNITLKDGLEEVRKWLKDGNGKHYIVTPNPEFLMRARKDRQFKEILNSAGLALPDGIGLILAGKLFKKPFKERIAGVNFMLELCKMAEIEGFSIGLIGGGEGVAVKTSECLKKRYPGLKVVLASEEWDLSKYNSIKNEAIDTFDGAKLCPLGQSKKAPLSINPEQLSAFKSESRRIDILFVAYGAPKQEKWIASNINSVPVKVAMGVGGSFDYLAGTVRRAPKFMQAVGLEWLYRLIREPWRFKRQLNIWKFGGLVIKEALRG